MECGSLATPVDVCASLLGWAAGAAYRLYMFIDGTCILRSARWKNMLHCYERQVSVLVPCHA